MRFDDVAGIICQAPRAGVMTSRWSLTREVRAFLTCLDPEVGFHAYFVAEDKAVDLHLEPAPNMQAMPAAAGSGGYWLPRHRMPHNSRNDGSCVLTWRALSISPYAAVRGVFPGSGPRGVGSDG